MSTDYDNRPIGVFDSGLGGLTVVRSLNALLPGEDIVYFGDTGRVPYGTRSAQTIAEYARQDEQWLLSKNVKMIIAACGTVSAVAPHTGDGLPVPFIGAVIPAVQQAIRETRFGRVGVIGTSATVASKAYERALKALRPDLTVFQKACPLFVPLVEEGWISPEDSITQRTVRRYLEPLMDCKMDTLILGCTHYPLLMDSIRSVVGKDVRLVNNGHWAAVAAADRLREDGLLSNKNQDGQCAFYVSDCTDNFSRLAGMFLGRRVEDSVCLVRLESL